MFQHDYPLIARSYFVSDIAVFVLKRDVILQPTNQPTNRSVVFAHFANRQIGQCVLCSTPFTACTVLLTVSGCNVIDFCKYLEDNILVVQTLFITLHMAACSRGQLLSLRTIDASQSRSTFTYPSARPTTAWLSSR